MENADLIKRARLHLDTMRPRPLEAEDIEAIENMVSVLRYCRCAGRFHVLRGGWCSDCDRIVKKYETLEPKTEKEIR